MNYSLDQMVGQRILLAFRCKGALTPEIRAEIQRYKPGGVTLFRPFNVVDVAQVRRLTTELQTAARIAGLPPLLIAADQEGGQLMAIGDRMTLLPGNMALGATGSSDLAYQAGQVLGRELAAVGVNVDYAPCSDVNLNPQNPVIGTRSFGEDPQIVANLSAAMIRGLQSEGVAATAKHFPGHGDTTSDSHHGIPVVPHNLERLRKVEFPPFIAAARAGVKLIMTAHIALPGVDGRNDLPATLSPTILKSLLRDEIGFEGLVLTDALDMHAIRQGEALGEEAVRAASAGSDLLLVTDNPDDHRRVYEGLAQAALDKRLSSTQMQTSVERILALKRWLVSQPQPDLDVIGSEENLAVAAEIARQSITLVHDRAGLLPLNIQPEERIALVLPLPADLTPADTSSYVIPTLAAELRHYHPNVDEFSVSHVPAGAEIAALRSALSKYRLVIVGTLNAFSQPAQAQMVQAILDTGISTVVVALRLPYDLAVFPEAKTYVCTYSILEPSMQALAQALFGKIPFRGRLPVSIPGMYNAARTP